MAVSGNSLPSSAMTFTRDLANRAGVAASEMAWQNARVPGNCAQDRLITTSGMAAVVGMLAR